MLRCAECKCLSERAEGWIALLGGDPDDDDAPEEVIAFCPPCASHEFRMSEKVAEDYI